jgi:hypothetical protein
MRISSGVLPTRSCRGGPRSAPGHVEIESVWITRSRRHVADTVSMTFFIVFPIDLNL